MSRNKTAWGTTKKQRRKHIAHQLRLGQTVPKWFLHRYHVQRRMYTRLALHQTLYGGVEKENACWYETVWHRSCASWDWS
jgi:hypothetical protein